uniref:Uncharacterized protein n=1 Tax=viral metagenome TaxID=1070528 RepID=A0A6C0H7P8_9ZZZZ
MLDNYYTIDGKYIEHMTPNDLCISSKNTTGKKLSFNKYDLISNNGPQSAIPFEHIIGILPKSAVISEIEFAISSTDQQSGAKDGTQYELVLRYGNIDYSLTKRIWCVNFQENKIDRYITATYKFDSYIATLDNEVKLVFKLYNLYGGGHSAKIVNYSINVTLYQ